MTAEMIKQQNAVEETRVVARNTAFMLAGQVLIKIFAFAFNVYVVRRLGDVYFGRYATAMAYVASFAMFTDLGTSSLSVREMARNEENIAWMVPNIVTVRAILSLLAMIIIPLSASIMGKNADAVLGILIASFGLLLYAFQGPLDSVLIAEERMDFSSAIKLLNQAVFMILGTALLVLGINYQGLLLASLGGTLAMGIASFYAVKRLGLRFNAPNPRRWWPLLQASFPFGVMGIISGFARRFDTVFMSFALSDEAVGWYNAPYNLVMMMLLAAQSLAIAMYPTMVKAYDSGRGSITATVQRGIRYLLLLSLPMAIGGSLLAERIIITLYEQEFAPAIPVMQILVWVLPPMFLSEILGRTSSTLHLEKKMVGVVIIYSLVNIALNIVLISTLGAIGAAIAVVTAYLFWIVLCSMVIGPAMLWKGNVLPVLRVFGAGALMGSVVWLLNKAPLLSSLDNKIALLLLIVVGALVYGISALALRTITSNEARFIIEAVQHRLKKLRVKK